MLFCQSTSKSEDYGNCKSRSLSTSVESLNSSWIKGGSRRVSLIGRIMHWWGILEMQSSGSSAWRNMFWFFHWKSRSTFIMSRASAASGGRLMQLPFSNLQMRTCVKSLRVFSLLVHSLPPISSWKSRHLRQSCRIERRQQSNLIQFKRIESIPSATADVLKTYGLTFLTGIELKTYCKNQYY